MRKRVALVVALLVSAFACSNGKRFEGNWQPVGSAGDVFLTISRDGNKYVVRDRLRGVSLCDLKNGSLNCGGGFGGPISVGFLESSGHITWHGMEFEKVQR